MGKGRKGRKGKEREEGEEKEKGRGCSVGSEEWGV